MWAHNGSHLATQRLSCADKKLKYRRSHMTRSLTCCSRTDVCSLTYTDFPTQTYLPDDLMSPILVPPWEVYMSKDKLEICEAQFKEHLASFIQNGQTPFISAHLYHGELPPILQYAYLICSGYLSRIRSNENMLLSILSSKIVICNLSTRLAQRKMSSLHSKQWLCTRSSACSAAIFVSVLSRKHNSSFWIAGPHICVSTTPLLSHTPCKVRRTGNGSLSRRSAALISWLCFSKAFTTQWSRASATRFLAWRNCRWQYEAIFVGDARLRAYYLELLWVYGRVERKSGWLWDSRLPESFVGCLYWGGCAADEIIESKVNGLNRLKE